jgi:hypothetical protein
LGQPSFAPPPELTQLGALVDVQVIVTGLPELTVVGEADKAAETTGHLSTTEA